LPEEDKEATNQTAQKQVEQIKLFHKLAREVINQTAQMTTRTITPVFQEGVLIWLEAKNLKLPYGILKLLLRCYRPFCIEKTINPVAFKL
jgi:hypothetical protein